MNILRFLFNNKKTVFFTDVNRGFLYSDMIANVIRTDVNN